MTKSGITALDGLSPAGEKRRERDLDVCVKITVTDSDISKRKTYYIDKDRQYIYAGNDGEGYAMPSGLTGILKSLGVYR